MAEFTSHIPGTFSWVDLSTTDQQAGVAFYRSLFGWDVNEQPMGPGATYSMFLLRGKDVAAASAMHPPERQAGVPPHWNMYISVTSADATAKQAESLGGKVLAPPFDVMDVGRMAVIQDPTGAVFCVWEPKKHIGAKFLNEPGSLCWSELATRDPKAAEAFYTKLFGWTAKHSAPAAVMEYTEFSVGGHPSIGMLAMPADMPPHVPSFWMPYFQVASCDASTKRAADLGATVMRQPQDIPKTGRFAILGDPQGAAFALFEFARVE
jgi:predicted enzyme related to lactoylglutathione lyase